MLAPCGISMIWSTKLQRSSGHGSRIERRAPPAQSRRSAEVPLRRSCGEKHVSVLGDSRAMSTNDEIKQLMGGTKAVPYRLALRRGHRTNPEPRGRIDHDGRLRAPLADPGQSRPGAQARHRVSTMYTAYRLNDANEIMPPHKHSPSAVRFGLKGKGNFTGVDGENIVFGPGDMVLTPERHLAQSRHRRRRAGAQSVGARFAAGRDAERRPFRP